VLLVEEADAGSIPDSELNWPRNADEVGQPFRSPIRAKNLLDRPQPKGVAAGFSTQLATIRRASIPYFQ
jgi:hypothetical protein